MTVKKEQIIEWSSKDKIVWSNIRTYNKHKRIFPEFRYGTAPYKNGEYYIGQYVGEKVYCVYFHTPGYFSLTGDSVPSETKILLNGDSLKNCKKYLADLIAKMYENKEIQDCYLMDC